jgi:signal transduction histidine kinase
MMPRLASVRQHISIPILARRDQLLGQIDITLEYGQTIEAYRETLSILAGQIGVALHKTRVLKLWEQERDALEHGTLEIPSQHKLKDEFLAAVSQELKTPLNAIMGWTPQPRLIEDLLDISQMISGSIHLECEDLDAAALLETSLDTIMPMLHLRQQKLVKHISAGPLRLRGDGPRLHQVFLNLLSNASKFTPDSGHIQVTLEEAGPYLRFEVSDSGKGIAAADIAQLFYCFHPGRMSGSHAPGGLGLGLAIVKHLVDMHGGTVTVKSEGEGHGATFTVLLPHGSARDQHPQRLRGS